MFWIVCPQWNREQSLFVLSPKLYIVPILLPSAKLLGVMVNELWDNPS